MRRFVMATLALALSSAALIPGEAVAADPVPVETFASRSLRAGLIQASLARMATWRAEKPWVRRFAEAVLYHAQRRNARLAGIVRAEGLGNASAEMPEHETHEIPLRTQAFHRLRVREGAAFDKQFLRAVNLVHENAIRGYEAETRSARADIREFVEEALPHLEAQLAEARRLLEEIEERQ